MRGSSSSSSSSSSGSSDFSEEGLRFLTVFSLVALFVFLGLAAYLLHRRAVRQRILSLSSAGGAKNGLGAQQLTREELSSVLPGQVDVGANRCSCGAPGIGVQERLSERWCWARSPRQESQRCMGDRPAPKAASSSKQARSSEQVDGIGSPKHTVDSKKPHHGLAPGAVPTETSEVVAGDCEEAMFEFREAAALMSPRELREFVEAHVEGELRQIGEITDPASRYKSFKALIAEWHPDKCPRIPTLATHVFQLLQERKQEVLSGGSCGGT